MTEIPNWVVYAAGIFFVINIVFYAALIYVLVFQVKPAMQRIGTKVGELTKKIEEVAQRIEDVAAHTKETIGNVGQKATGILGSVELIAQSASRQFERFSPFIVGAMTAMRLVKSLNEMRQGKTAMEATKGKTLEKQPATPPKKRFGIF
ncbi:MAG TPA: hypothetical protein VK934_00275 [Fimbriimonas sp.]|nr:hypothetical protein [Fimbriimonas sp.]